MKTPKYQLLEGDEDIYSDDKIETVPIQICDGKYKDVIFRFLKISYNEIESKDSLTVDLTYDILNDDEEKYSNDEEFSSILTQIFENILINE